MVYQITKRTIDISVASLGLLLCSPLLFIAGVGVRRFVRGPVLFRQLRAGLHGRQFYLLKLRTLRDAEEGLADSERSTRFGRFLRRTSIDELPQLWNVLKGEMSLVGPRPLLVEYLPLYTAEQARRHDVKPGITGLAQVNGRNALGWEERFALDVRYVDQRSLALDAGILLQTLVTVIRGEGIRHEGHATMPPFTGSVSRPAEPA